MQLFDTTKDVIRTLPDRKRYLEFITALLSVPVLITVIYSNINAIKNGQKKEEPKQVIAAETPIVVKIEEPSPTLTAAQENTAKTVEISASPNSQAEKIKECTKTVGPVGISSPKMGETLTENPLLIDVSYTQGDYCSVVWSYRINGSTWSEFTDKAIFIHNLTQGEKKLEVRVRSIASKDEKTLETTFMYKPTIATSPSTESTNSAQLN